MVFAFLTLSPCSFVNIHDKKMIQSFTQKRFFLGISRIMSLQDLLSSNIVAAGQGLHVAVDSLLYKREGPVVFNSVVRREVPEVFEESKRLIC